MASPIYRFGELRLDPASRELWRGDEELALPRKVFDCIVYLVEHRDRAVERDELFAAVWGEVHLSDGVLTQTIVEARRALHDTGDDQHFIKTVRGFGYRWAAPVEPVELEETEPAAAPDRRPARLRRWPAFAAIGALVAVLAIGAGYLWRWTESGSGGADAPLAAGDIALLLPVTVESGEQHPWIRLGLMDLIATRLRTAGQPVVPSDTVIALLRDREAGLASEEIDDLVAATGARLVLSARAESGGETWRVALRSLHGARPALSTLGEDRDVIAAARLAADRMALFLGLTPAPDATRESGLSTLLQRIEAAILAQQMDVARKLIEEADPALRRRSEVRLKRGRIEYFSRNLDAARSILESLLDGTPPGRDPVFRAQVLHGLGAVHYRSGDHESAEPLLMEALNLLEQDGREQARIELGRVQIALGTLIALARGPEASREHLARARVTLESTGDLLGLARLDNNLGALEIGQGRYTEALRYFERAARHHQALNDVGGELRARLNGIQAHLSLLEPRAATAMLPRVRELVVQAANPQLTVYAQLARAELLDATGRDGVAEGLLQEVLSTTEGRADLESLRVEAVLLHAERTARDGELVAAGRIAAEIVESAPRRYDVPLAHARLVQVRGQLAAGDPASAAKLAKATVDREDAESPPATHVYTALVEAEVTAATGSTESAARAFERALELADSSRVPMLLLRACEAYVAWLLAPKPDAPPDPEQALLVVSRLDGHADRHFDAALLQLRVYHALGLPSAWRRSLAHARSLAGERRIPDQLLVAPRRARSAPLG